MARKNKESICIDFDGVINSYVSGYARGSLPDPPVPGALDYLREITQHFKVIILSTRAENNQARKLICRWLAQHGLEDEVIRQLKITNVKSGALIYIDDRGYRFEGDNFPSAAEIDRLRPWNK